MKMLVRVAVDALAELPIASSSAASVLEVCQQSQVGDVYAAPVLADVVNGHVVRNLTTMMNPGRAMRSGSRHPHLTLPSYLRIAVTCHRVEADETTRWVFGESGSSSRSYTAWDIHCLYLLIAKKEVRRCSATGSTGRASSPRSTASFRWLLLARRTTRRGPSGTPPRSSSSTRWRWRRLSRCRSAS